MVYEDILPHYLAIGVSWERFMDSCPKELEAYDKAHNNQIIEQDYLQYLWWGNYGVSALTVAIDHCFNKKATSEYIKKPIMTELKEQKSEITEEEKQRQVDLFFAREKARRVNWRRSHKKD